MTASQLPIGSQDERIGHHGRRLLADPVWRIVWRTAKGASRTSKWGFALQVLAPLLWLPFGWQLLHTHYPGVARPALVMVGFLFVSAFGLCAAASLLQQAMLQDARSQSRLPPEPFRAIPLISFVAAVLLALGFSASSAAAVAIADGPVLLAPVMLFTAAGILVCGVRVDHATRLLHESAMEQARLAARAERGASEAQLAALQAQLSPHFLFNTLNTVAALVRTRPQAAERTVENLADVLRSTLSRSAATLQPLREEIEFLKAYLGIEQERMGERLRVVWSIAPDALDVPVPPFTLQPLVENALKHAIGNRLSGGTLRITAVCLEGALMLRVEDDGDGFPPGWTEGVGLKNLHGRLATLYGGRALLQVQNGAPGAKLTVTLPLDPA